MGRGRREGSSAGRTVWRVLDGVEGAFGVSEEDVRLCSRSKGLWAGFPKGYWAVCIVKEKSAWCWCR